MFGYFFGTAIPTSPLDFICYTCTILLHLVPQANRRRYYLVWKSVDVVSSLYSPLILLCGSIEENLMLSVVFSIAGVKKNMQ